MKTETSSFRLEKKYFDDLKDEAKKQNLTVNSLINKIIKEYVEWNSLAPALEIIPLGSPLISALLKGLSDEQIRKIAREHTKENAMQNLRFLKNEETVDTFLEVAQNWCEASGFAYTIRENNDTTKFTVRHNKGNKFSILLSEIIKTYLEELNTKSELKVSSKTISFSV